MRLITSCCQGCSNYLLDFASSIMHFTIIPLMLCVLPSWLTSSVGESIQLSLAMAGSRCFSSAINARLSCLAARLWLTCALSKLGFDNLGHCYAMDLLFIRCFEHFVPFHLLGNAFVDSAIPTQQLTVMTLPWKCLLQTCYNIIEQFNKWLSLHASIPHIGIGVQNVRIFYFLLEQVLSCFLWIRTNAHFVVCLNF
jgi:hypothetical protein